MKLRRKLFGSEVASCEYVFQAKAGRRRRVLARIGKPYRESSRGWACPVEIRGFEPRYPDARGVDSMQALCLATWLIRSRFEDFIAKGGRVFDAQDGSEWGARGVMATFGPVSGGAA